MVHHHRDVQGGNARAAVFGVSDGLVSNVALILGIAGASTDGSLVRLAGVSGLLAGAISMAAGEWVSVRAQNELIERELEIERRSLAENPEAETRELAAIFRDRGLDPEQAAQVAEGIMSDPDVAVLACGATYTIGSVLGVSVSELRGCRVGHLHSAPHASR